MLSGLVQEKMSSVPKEVTLHQRNHLKENQREPKHQDIEDVMSQIGGLLFPVQLWLGWLRHIVIASCWWADVTFWQDQIKLDFQLRGGGGLDKNVPLAPPTSIVTRQHCRAIVRNIVSARPGRSRMNADDFMPTRKIDAVCAAMIDLKDSFKIRSECLQTQP